MTQIGASPSLISPMEAPNYRRGNLLSPPHHSSFALYSHSNTTNPSAQTEDQPIFERKRFRKPKPKSKNLRFVRSTPLVFETNKALSILTKSGKYSAALSEFNKLQSQGTRRIDLYTFTIAINSYCHVNRVGFGFALLGGIFKRGYTPGVVTFRTLLHRLVILNKAVEAVELFEKIVKKGEIKPDVTTYGLCINRLCEVGNTGAAISFLRIAEDGGLNPDSREYNMIIDRLCKDGLVDDALNILVGMSNRGIRADVFNYTTLIDGLCKHGKWKEATAMLREMVDSDISPNAHTINVLVSALSKQGRTKEAEELLEVVEGHVDLNVVTYNSIMVGYCLQGRMDEAMRLLNAMVDRGIRPDTYSYNILIQGYCKNMKLDEAMHLFRLMPLQGLKRNIVTFKNILRCPFQIGRDTAAQEILNEMQAAGLIPETHFCGFLFDGLCRSGHIDEAMFLLNMMKEKGLCLDIVRYKISLLLNIARKKNLMMSKRSLH